jgi:hypothetical protein
MITGLERPDESYFPPGAEEDEEDYIAGPDFVNLDEKLEAVELDTTQDDEAAVRRLVRRSNGGSVSWVSNIIGWNLFSVDEESGDAEDEAEDGDGGDGEAGEMPDEAVADRRFDDLPNLAGEDMAVPAPNTDEGGWRDAAWLLTVATKVIL